MYSRFLFVVHAAHRVTAGTGTEARPYCVRLRHDGHDVGRNTTLDRQASGGKNGSSSLNTAQLYSPSAGTWVAAANLNAPREQHTATFLPSGKVLFAAGLNGTTTLATAAVYDPSSGAGTWTATRGPLPSALKSHTATLLSTSNAQLNGKVLVTGGNSGSATRTSVYLFDPAQVAFSTLANLPSAREGQTATVLANGKVLLSGGKNGSTALNTAVLFDPGTGPGSWSTVGAMTAARQGHTASLLSNGQVLVAGGSNGTSSLSSAELFNGTSTWATTPAMPAPVQGHTASVASDGSWFLSTTIACCVEEVTLMSRLRTPSVYRHPGHFFEASCRLCRADRLRR